jgi:hypothetical protein
MIVAVTVVLPLFTAVNDGMFPVPLAASPMLGVLFVQLYVVTLVPLKLIAAVVPPLHTVWSAFGFIVGTGFTVNVAGKL